MPASTRLLLDTCAWIDAFYQPQLLADSVRRLLREQTVVYVSAISPWEVAVKEAKGKIQFSIPIERWMKLALPPGKVCLLPLVPEIAVASARLPGPLHPDPADRIIIATARHHHLRLLTSDEKILRYSHVSTAASR